MGEEEREGRERRAEEHEIDEGAEEERERAISIDAILAQSSDLIFDLLQESCQILPEKCRRTIWQSAAGG